MTEPAKKLGVKEIIKAIKKLSPTEKESLAILADPELKEGFLKMAKEAEKELRTGKTVSANRFFKELDRASG